MHLAESMLALTVLLSFLSPIKQGSRHRRQDLFVLFLRAYRIANAFASHAQSGLFSRPSLHPLAASFNSGNDNIHSMGDRRDPSRT